MGNAENGSYVERAKDRPPRHWESSMPDQPVDLSSKILPPEQRTEFTPEERAEFEAWSDRIDRTLEELHARADERLRCLGITP